MARLLGFIEQQVARIMDLLLIMSLRCLMRPRVNLITDRRFTARWLKQPRCCVTRLSPPSRERFQTEKGACGPGRRANCVLISIVTLQARTRRRSLRAHSAQRGAFFARLQAHIRQVASCLPDQSTRRAGGAIHAAD